MPEQSLAELIRDPHIKALTFDVSGTLVNWEQGLQDSFRELLQKQVPQNQLKAKARTAVTRWLEVERAIIHKTLKNPLEFRNFDEIMREGVDAAVQAVLHRPATSDEKKQFLTSTVHWPHFGDVPGFFMEVKQHQPDLEMVLLTNGPRLPAQRLVEEIRTTGLRARALFAEEAGSYKPDLAVFRWALRKLGLQPGQILHLSSSPTFDLDAASRLGWNVLHVRRPTKHKNLTRHPYVNTLSMEARVRRGRKTRLPPLRPR